MLLKLCASVRPDVANGRLAFGSDVCDSISSTAISYHIASAFSKLNNCRNAHYVGDSTVYSLVNMLYSQLAIPYGAVVPVIVLYIK